MLTQQKKRISRLKLGLLGALGMIVLAWMIAPAMAAMEPIAVWYSASDPDTMEVVKEWIRDFERKYNVKVDLAHVQQWQQALKIGAAAAAGRLPDVISLPASQAMVMIDQGFVQPIDDILDEMGRDRFIEPCIDWYTYGGKEWGVPNRLASPFVMWYRTDLYEKYGLNIPVTWSQLAGNAEKIGNAEADIFGIELPVELFAHTSDIAYTMMLSNGATIFDKDGNVVLNSPETREMLEFYKDTYERLSPPTGGWKWTEVKMSFWRGKVAHVCYQYSIPADIPKFAPELWDKTSGFFMPSRKGRTGRWKTFTTSNAFMVTKNVTGERRRLVKELIKMFFDPPERYARFLLGDPGDDQPVLKETLELGSPWWQHDVTRHWQLEILSGFYLVKDFVPFAMATGYKTPASGLVYNGNILAEMIQKFVVGRESAEEVLEETVEAIKGVM